MGELCNISGCLYEARLLLMSFPHVSSGNPQLKTLYKTLPAGKETITRNGALINKPGGNSQRKQKWIPAFAGMTWVSCVTFLAVYMRRVHC